MSVTRSLRGHRAAAGRPVRAPPERRLVDGRRKPPRRRRGQRPGIAGPGDIDEVARAAAHAGDFEMLARARETASPTCAPATARHPGRGRRWCSPIRRSRSETRFSGKAKRRSNGLHVRDIGRLRTAQRTARDRVQGREAARARAAATSSDTHRPGRAHARVRRWRGRQGRDRENRRSESKPEGVPLALMRPMLTTIHRLEPNLRTPRVGRESRDWVPRRYRI